MKIAYLYDAVHPYEKGGAQKRVWELSRRLADDHEVHLFGMHYWDGPETIEKDGITYHGVSPPYDLYVGERRAIPPAIKFATRLAPYLLSEDFDVVDCQQFPYFPVFTAKLHELARRSELVVTWYEVWDDYWHDYLGWTGWFGKAVERAALRLPGHVVPISEYIADDLRDVGRTEGLSVVENGVDYHALQEIPAAEEDWDAVYVGRLAEHKRVEWLLEAVATASDRMDRPPRTCIVGDGPERESLEAHAEEVGVDDHVTFQGFVEADEDVIGHMKAADLFVLPSIREGFPNTILEANACGVPTVVVDHPENGSTGVVKDGETGFVVEPNADAIADRIVTLLADDTLLEDLSEGARRYGEAHDWNRIVDDLEEVYSKALRQSN
jgi:glycosyltransferase involved in cell wall biosynthesis